jgi:hypothetical protein
MQTAFVSLIHQAAFASIEQCYKAYHCDFRSFRSTDEARIPRPIHGSPTVGCGTLIERERVERVRTSLPDVAGSRAMPR